MAGAGFGAAFRQLRGLFGNGSVVGLGDGQLLARYADSKDEAAFGALVARHGPMVLATCRAVLKNEHDVEDAFQATFLVLARKAHSVRGGEALGGWLHRVARRASVQAGVEAKRRRLKEAEASARRIPNRAEPDPELAALLHEEIDRLPESRRLPVVLCDLEGLTSEQAARHLRWTEPTVRHRLADARKRLKVRLTRRGVMAPTIGALVTSSASAAVPPLLARMTLSAATGGTASAGATLLAHIVLRGMLMTQIKIATTAALAALALASAGLIAAGAGRPEDPKPAMKPKPEPRAALVAREEPVARKPIETVEVKGRVVAPDGKPVVGAVVRAEYYSSGEAQVSPSVASRTDGRFTLRLPKPSEAEQRGFLAIYPRLLATAPGFGVGWTDRALRADRPDEQVIALVGDGPPIEGRVVDLEGRPVGGANLEVARIYFEAKNDFADWVAKARKGAAGTNLWPGLESLNVGLERLVPIAARTDADGRFKLAGIGRDRVAELIVSGPGVASTEVHAMSRDEPEIRLASRAGFTLPPILIHGPRLQIALAPSKRVAGVVRDQDSGEPIAGLKIEAGVFEERSVFRVPGVEATTDARGRYRLDGLPKASSYRLFFSTPPGLPYSRGTMKAPAGSPGLEPVAFDFALRKGLFARGTVTDKVTGRPIRGTVVYLPFSDNAQVGEFPGLTPLFDMQFTRIGEDGRYEIVALPGHGLLAVMDSESRYRAGTGLEAIKGYDADMHGFTTMPPIPANGYNAFAETNFDPKAGSPTVDLQVDSGRPATVQVVDPEGRPLGGTRVRGLGAQGWPITEDRPSSSFEVLSLDPSQARRVVVAHEGRKLVGSAVLRGDEPGPVTIRLQPWGVVTGRIVDDEVRPRKNLILGNANDRRSAAKSEDRGDLPVGLAGGSGEPVGNDGRFRVEGLVPGLKYGGYAVESAMVLGDVFRDVTVAPGETKDLGDLKVQPFKPRGN